MATAIFVDLDARRCVQSALSTAPADLTGLFRGDNETYEVYFLRQTNDSAAPFVFESKSAASLKVGLGLKNFSPTEGTWTLDGNSLGYAATAAQIQTALRTSQADASLTVIGSMADGFTVTWGAVGAETLLVGSAANLLPQCDLTIDTRRDGGASTIEQQFVRVRLSPAAYQDTWTDLSTTVAATITEVVAGSATASEVQKIALSPKPVSGNWTITVPADTRSVTAAVVAGVFTTTANHGFVVGQPVVMTGFTNEANWTEGTTYYVQSVPSATTYTISATSGGAVISTATADAGSGTVTTLARTTATISATATPSAVQSALEALDCIGTGGASVSGITSSFYQIQFSGNKKLANFPAVTAQVGGLLAAYGKTGTFSLATFQMADLLTDESSVEMSFEVQLVESSRTTTACSQQVFVSADLIDGATLAPIPLSTFAALFAAADLSGLPTSNPGGVLQVGA